MEPEYPVGPDFEEAREWVKAQEYLLTEEQKRVYQEFEANERAIEKELKANRDVARDAADKEKPVAGMSMSPGWVHPDQSRLSIVQEKLQAAEQEVRNFDREHAARRVEWLKDAEQQRQRQLDEQEQTKREQDDDAKTRDLAMAGIMTAGADDAERAHEEPAADSGREEIDADEAFNRAVQAQIDELLWEEEQDRLDENDHNKDMGRDHDEEGDHDIGDDR